MSKKISKENKSPNQRRPDGGVEGAKNWSLDQIREYMDRIENDPDCRAKERFHILLEGALFDPEINKSEVFSSFAIVLRECIHGFQPGWDLYDIFYPIATATTREAKKKREAGLAEAKNKIIEKWLDEGEKYRSRQLFADAMEQEFKDYKVKVRASTIYRTWTSKKSIKEYLQARK